jgi:hypothetical protein
MLIITFTIWLFYCESQKLNQVYTYQLEQGIMATVVASRIYFY